MRDYLIIFGMIAAAIVVGAGLFFFGPASFRAVTNTPTGISFRLLKEGTNAITMNDRANYQIESQSQLNELWTYLQATPGSVPSINFDKEEVLVVFDGTHTTGGYSIAVDQITEKDGVRMVHVVRTSPGTNCVTTEGVTSPYQVVVVSKTDIALSHEDQSVVRNCP